MKEEEGERETSVDREGEREREREREREADRERKSGKDFLGRVYYYIISNRGLTTSRVHHNGIRILH